MTNIQFTKLSWEELHKDCLQTFKKMNDIQIDKIVSISRGGMVVSRIFSDLLGNAPISHITISSYAGINDHKEPKITEIPSTDFKNKTILIIDEVSDTGVTFQHAIEYFQKLSPKKIYTLSPYMKPHTKFIPDFWIKKLDSWIIFPYDVRETAEAFKKMFTTTEHTREKLLEVGFTKDEIDAVIS